MNEEKFIKACELEKSSKLNEAIDAFQLLLREPYWKIPSLWRLAKIMNKKGFNDIALVYVDELEEELKKFRDDTGGDDDLATPVTPR